MAISTANAKHIGIHHGIPWWHPIMADASLCPRGPVLPRGAGRQPPARRAEHGGKHEAGGGQGGDVAQDTGAFDILGLVSAGPLHAPSS